MKTLVSVIIPTYNRNEFIKRAVESVLKQSFKQLELIVVDDCSNDNTTEIVKDIQDDRIIYIRNHNNLGASASRNIGIKKSKADVIAFLDSDDEWKENKLDEQFKLLERESKNIGCVYSGIEIRKRFSGSKVVVPNYRGYIYKKQLERDRFVGTGSTLMVKKKCILKAGFYDENLPARQDYDFTIRLSKYFKVDFVKKALSIVWRDSNDRITSARNRRIGGEIILEKIRKDLDCLSILDRRRIIASHLFEIGRFCFYGDEKEIGKKYIFKSLYCFPMIIVKRDVMHFFKMIL